MAVLPFLVGTGVTYIREGVTHSSLNGNNKKTSRDIDRSVSVAESVPMLLLTIDR